MDSTYHGTDDQLENYALGRLPDSELPPLEEHLLMCAGCRERLDLAEQFALGMRDALYARAVERAEPSPWLAWIRRPAFSMAAACVLLIAGLFVFLNGRAQVAPSAKLQLTAMRGSLPFTAAARETDLTLMDAPAAGGHFRIELLDASGRTQWTGQAESDSKGAEVRVQRRLTPGDYFVRLYDNGGKLLHEYGFRVRQ